MKRNTARKWIGQTAKTQLPGLVLLIFGNALASVCAVSLALFAKRIIDAAQYGDKTRLLQSAVLLTAVILLVTENVCLSKARTNQTYIHFSLELNSERFGKAL